MRISVFKFCYAAKPQNFLCYVSPTLSLQLLWLMDLDSWSVAGFGIFTISWHPPIKFCSKTLGPRAPEEIYLLNNLFKISKRFDI